MKATNGTSWWAMPILALTLSGCGVGIRSAASPVETSLPHGGVHRSNAPAVIPGVILQTAWVSPRVGYIFAAKTPLGEGVAVYATQTGGRRWQRVWHAAHLGTAVDGMVWRGMRGYVWAPTMTGSLQVWTTSNGGGTWQAVAFPSPVANLATVGTGVLVAKTAREPHWILRAADGHRWKALPSVPNPNPLQVLFTTALTGYWMTQHSLWHTTNGGQSWTRAIDSPTSEVLTSLAQSPQGTIWVAGAPVTGRGSRSILWISTAHGGWQRRVITRAVPSYAMGGLGSDGLSVDGPIALATDGAEQVNGGSPQVLLTRDAGVHWRDVRIPRPPHAVSSAWANRQVASVTVINERDLAMLVGGAPFNAGGAAAVLEYSRNDGRSWSPVAVSQDAATAHY